MLADRGRLRVRNVYVKQSQVFRCPMVDRRTCQTNRLLTSSVRVRRVPSESAVIPQRPSLPALPRTTCLPSSVAVRLRPAKTARIFAHHLAIRIASLIRAMTFMFLSRSVSSAPRRMPSDPPVGRLPPRNLGHVHRQLPPSLSDSHLCRTPSPNWGLELGYAGGVVA
jgi:hypothetical protein